MVLSLASNAAHCAAVHEQHSMVLGQEQAWLARSQNKLKGVMWLACCLLK